MTDQKRADIAAEELRNDDVQCVNCEKYGHENCCIGCGTPIGVEYAQRRCGRCWENQ